MNIVIVTTYPLTNLRVRNSGVYQRLRMILEAARKASCLVTLVWLTPADATSEFERTLETEMAAFWSVHVCIRCAKIKTSALSRLLLKPLVGSGFKELMLSLINSKTVVIAHRIPAMAAVRRAIPTTIPIIFDLDNLEHERQQELMLFHKKMLDTVRFKCAEIISKIETQKAAERAHATLVCSWKDVDSVRRIFYRSRPAFAPNGIRIPSSTTPVMPTGILMMVANYNDFFNVEGARWFMHEVWPRIVARKPDTQMLFVGDSGKTIFKNGVPPDSVKALGFVERLAPLYAEAQALICPVCSGGGTRIKILEAIAYERPIVTTTAGVDGLDFDHNKDVLIADSAEMFAMHCVQLLSSVTNCKQLAMRAKTQLLMRYEHDHTVNRLTKIIRTA